MQDEIEELWELANECRGWAKEFNFIPVERRIATINEFKRLANKLDEIANRLAGRMPV